MKTENEIISQVVEAHIGQLIKNAYAKEAGLDPDNPDFWEKLNKYKEKQIEEEPVYEPEICPYCGQEIY